MTIDPFAFSEQVTFWEKFFVAVVLALAAAVAAVLAVAGRRLIRAVGRYADARRVAAELAGTGNENAERRASAMRRVISNLKVRAERQPRALS